MGQPVFYLLAGPNGAGKSTLYRALVLAGTIPATAEFVNADVHEAAHLQHIADPEQRSEQARQWAEARRTELLQAGESFVSETVFSHASKLALIQEAQAAGFFVMLLVVALDQPERLLVRVTQRVLEGGHAVPAERILSRYPRTLAYLTQAVRHGRRRRSLRLRRRITRHTHCCGRLQRRLDARTAAAHARMGAADSLGLNLGSSLCGYCASSY